MSVDQTNEEVSFGDIVVNIPGMGPGSEKASWWLSYIQELILFGKLEAVLQYLLAAQRAGALSVLQQACLERLRQQVKEKMESKKEKKPPIRTHKSGTFNKVKKGPGIARVVPSPTKSEPYFFRTG